MNSPVHESSTTMASSRRGLEGACSGTSVRASTAVVMRVSWKPASASAFGLLGPTPAGRDRFISIDHTSHTSLPCGQKSRVREQRVSQLALDDPCGLLGGRVLVHPGRPAQVGEL